MEVELGGRGRFEEKKADEQQEANADNGFFGVGVHGELFYQVGGVNCGCVEKTNKWW